MKLIIKFKMKLIDIKKVGKKIRKLKKKEEKVIKSKIV